MTISSRPRPNPLRALATRLGTRRPSDAALRTPQARPPAAPSATDPHLSLNTVWVRLDDALPLAEHAVACPRHRLSTAQVLANAPTRPALVWQATPTGDQLSSNGAPAWFDEDGDEHTAWAWTWQHTATGRRASAAVPGYDTAYLPLDTDRDGPALIDVLRDARYLRRHWIAITLNPDQRHLVTPRDVRALDHRDQIAPPTRRGYRHGSPPTRSASPRTRHGSPQGSASATGT